MPQELHVIRCYSCESFQVHIVKKSNKWDCKMCGEKQSIKKVYFQGSGKDCRLNVQKLNEKRILNDLKSDNTENLVNASDEFINENENFVQEVNQNSKWEEFLNEHEETSDNEVEQTNYTFSRPNKRKSFTKKSNENKKIKRQPEELPDEESIEENISNHIQSTSTSKWKNVISNIESNSQNVENEEKIKTTNTSKWKNFISNLENNSQNVLKENEVETTSTSKWKNFISNIENTPENVLKKDEVETISTSKWKNFITNIERNPQNVLKDVSLLTHKSDSSSNDKNKISKWDCFVEDSEDDTEIPDHTKISESLNIDFKQSSSNIFSSNDNNLDDILDL